MASNQSPQPANAAEALEHLGRLSLREHSMKSLLQTVAELTKTVMPGDTEASITLLVKDSPTTVVSTGQLALDLDETQYERDHGPCLHAARTTELTEITDTRTDSRWPDYMPRAAEHGNLSSLSVPLAIDEDEQVTGALNIYAREPHAFDEESRAAATKFAPYAAVAAGNLHAYRSARDMADKPADRPGDAGSHRPGQRHPDGAPQAHRRPGVPGPGPDVDEDEPQAARGRRRPGPHRRTSPGTAGTGRLTRAGSRRVAPDPERPGD